MRSATHFECWPPTKRQVWRALAAKLGFLPKMLIDRKRREAPDAAIGATAAKERSVRDQVVCVCCGESTVSVLAGTTLLNDRSDDRCCNAEDRLLQVQPNAASATYPNINVGKVRILSVQLERSEGPVYNFFATPWL